MITSLFAALLALLYMKITFATIKGRRSQKVSLGSGENNEILAVTSAHNNFSNYVPVFLILFYLVETQFVFPQVLYIIGAAFLLGRILHFKGMTRESMDFKNRVRGMQLTIFPLILLAGLNLYIFVSKLLGF